MCTVQDSMKNIINREQGNFVFFFISMHQIQDKYC